jgi:hypothetical protein
MLYINRFLYLKLQCFVIVVEPDDMLYIRIKIQRSGDISGLPTAILQFSSEMQQTWHSYY